VSCDGNFSGEDFDKLSEEKARLEAARTRAIAEAASLDRRIEALKKAQGKMIAREAAALEELEREEERQAQQANVALDSVFDEQQLAAFFGAPEGSDSGGGNSQVSQG